MPCSCTLHPHVLRGHTRTKIRQKHNPCMRRKGYAMTRPAARSDVVAGIDLGTTNSCIAIVQEGEPEIVPDADGRLVVPSVVSIQPGGEIVVGWAAKRGASMAPQSTFYSLKRIIGREYAECTSDVATFCFEVKADEDGMPVLPTDAGQLAPEEISGVIISELLDQVADYSGVRPSKAVIGVPAYFSDGQREATIRAGLCAGLDVVRLLHEPVAAALAYGIDLEEDNTVLVFDLGGGTFDVSILEVGGWVIEILATGGDAHLGGDDFDAAIADWLIRTHLSPRGVDCSDPAVRANVRALAEAAKIRLSSQDSVELTLPVGGAEPLRITVTQQLFEDIVKDLFRRLRLPIDQCCWQAGVDLGSSSLVSDDGERSDGAEEDERMRTKRQAISDVLLVGGATRMPAIRRFVKNMTGIAPRDGLLDPDLAVALGAGIQAGIFQGEIEDVMIMDPWKASLMRAFASKALEREAEDLPDE